jgi:hypothetical protein
VYYTYTHYLLEDHDHHEQNGEHMETSIPSSVSLSGRERPVVSLETIAAVESHKGSNDNENEYLRRDFYTGSFLKEFPSCTKITSVFARAGRATRPSPFGGLL